MGSEGRDVLNEWLAFLKAVPGAAKAFTEVVGELGHAGAALVRIGTAKAEQKVQAIKSDTQMATEVSEALTRVAVLHIEKNADSLGPRALAYGARRFVKQQQNREAVTFEALEPIRLNPPDEPPKGMPSDDWLNVFGKLAENASSEKLRAHFAHVLESEIRTPGAISFAALHMVALLDDQLAQRIERVRPFIFEKENIAVIGHFRTSSDAYLDLVSLANIGFLHLAQHGVGSDDSKDAGVIAIFRCETKIVIVPTQPELDARLLQLPAVQVPAALISQAGQELLSSLAPVPQSAQLPAYLRDWLLEQGYDGVRIEPLPSELAHASTNA